MDVLMSGSTLLIYGALLWLFLIWPSQLVGAAAKARGRSYGAWFLLALPFNALFMWLLLLILPDLSEED